MAASKILTQDTIASIVADWKTGNFTQRDLAYKYKLSVGAVNKHTKGLNKEHEQLVNKLVEAKQELSQLDERSVHAVNEIVEERTKHISDDDIKPLRPEDLTPFDDSELQPFDDSELQPFDDFKPLEALDFKPLNNKDFSPI